MMKYLDFTNDMKKKVVIKEKSIFYNKIKLFLNY